MVEETETLTNIAGAVKEAESHARPLRNARETVSRACPCRRRELPAPTRRLFPPSFIPTAPLLTESGGRWGEASGDEPVNGRMSDKTQLVEKAVDDSIGVFGISVFFSRVRNKTKCRRFSA